MKIEKILKESKKKKCKPWQIRLKCLGCGKIYCRSVPLSSCVECGAMIETES